MPLAVVMAELQEVAKDIAVASLQLFEIVPLGLFLLAKQGTTATVVAYAGQKQTIMHHTWRNMAQFFQGSLLRMKSASFSVMRIA
jgi:hypothetical protein